MLLLLACTEPGPTNSAIDDETWDALFEDDSPERVTASWAQPRFTEGGEPVAEPETWYSAADLVVVQTGDGGVRYRRHASGLDLLFWVDRADLDEVLAADVWLGPDGRVVEDGGAGVWLPPGDHADEEGWLHSRAWPIDVSVRVAPALLDVEWTRTGPPPAPKGEKVHVSGELTGDDGEPFVTLPAAMEGVVVEEGEDAVLVEVRAQRMCSEDEVVVRGWADPEDVVTGGRSRTWSTWCCGFGRIGNWWREPVGEPVVVAEGSLVHDAPGGSVMGRAYEDTVVPLAPEEAEVDGLRAVSVQTGLGPTTVWTTVTDWDPVTLLEP